MAGKFQVYMDKSGEFRFKLVASNGQTIAVSEGYNTKASALEGIRSVVTTTATATTEDLTEAKK
jgi:hypothetical protein